MSRFLPFAIVHLIVLGGSLIIGGCGSGKTSGIGSPEQTLQDNARSEHAAIGTNDGKHSSPPTASQNVLFVDVAAERGLNYLWPQQSRPMTTLDAFGAGCAAFDADNDGWQDVMLVGSPFPALFRNEGGARFLDVTDDSGLRAVPGRWTGCSIGDYDGDGLLDVLLTGYHQLALFKNAGSMQFRDVTAEAGFDPSNQGYWGASAGFMDLDGDSWLDLVILNYVIYGPDSQKYCEFKPGVKSGCPPKSYPAERGQIWRNTGMKTFELVPPEHGMQATRGVGLVLAYHDLDDDGLMDFYLGNDAVLADMLHNQGHLMFENIATLAGVATSASGDPVASMGADWGDFDRDGRLDLAVSNWYGKSFVLFRNLENRFFVDCAQGTDLTRITKNRLGFGTKWVDFENDGWPDLFFVNGHVYDNSAEVHATGEAFRQQMCLCWNNRGKSFVDVVPQMGPDVRRSMVGRGSATIDFDNDGRVDLLAVDFEGPAMLLENRTTTTKHWLKLDLRGKAPNVFAYGAHVVGKSGDRIWVAEVSPASSYLSSSDPRIHWGMDDVVSLDSLTIRWRSGSIQVLRNVAADQIIRVVEGVP